MIPLHDIVASNEHIASRFPSGLVVVIVGGTNGVGENTVKALAKHASKPRVYIVGRSQEAAGRIIGECQQLNPDGKFEFIQGDVSLVKTVDEVCGKIKSKESAINILLETQGTMAFKSVTSEGLPVAAATVMYSRIRFIRNLLPLIQNAQSLRRVVSVLAATCEGAIDTSNIPAANFSLIQWRNQVAAIQTLMLGELSRQAPDVSFIHASPGIVKGGIKRQAEGFRLGLLIAISSIFEPLVQMPPVECGERTLFLGTSAVFPPADDSADVAGVPLGGKLTEARGCDGKIGSGVYSVDHRGGSAPPRVEKVLAGHREDGTSDKVWKYLAADFTRLTGAEVMV